MSGVSFAAGLEKDVLWSGKYVGSGGAAVSNASGAEALYYNPAGIGLDKAGAGSVSVNVSPTFAQYSGPITTANTSLTSNNKLLPVFGALASYNLTKDFALGIGAYSAGGTRAEYDNVQFGSYSYTPNIRNDLTLTEFALGGSYQLMPGFSIGAAWRILMVRGEVASASASSALGAGSYIAADFDNLKQTKYNGIRLGAQYKSEDKRWGVGASFRNAVGFDAAGTGTGELLYATNGSSTPLVGSAATVSAVFPWQLGLGGNAELMSNFRALFDYVYSHYQTDQYLGVAGTVTLPASLGGSVQSLPSSFLNWSNMTNIRLGFEYTGLYNWALRAGYVYTSQVTPDKYATAAQASPANGNTITLGAGTWMAAKTVELNGALEYSFAKGTDTTAPVAGVYKTRALGLHLGTTYNF